MIANSIENDTADQRQELLEALSRRTKEWAILHRVAQLPIESPDLNAVLDHSLDKVSEAIAVETAAVLFMTEQKQEVICYRPRRSITSVFKSGKTTANQSQHHR